MLNFWKKVNEPALLGKPPSQALHWLTLKGEDSGMSPPTDRLPSVLQFCCLPVFYIIYAQSTVYLTEEKQFWSLKEDIIELTVKGKWNMGYEKIMNIVYLSLFLIS